MTRIRTRFITPLWYAFVSHGMYEFRGITFPGKDRLRHGPYVGVTPMVAYNINHVALSWYEVESDIIGSNGLSDTILGRTQLWFLLEG